MKIDRGSALVLAGIGVGLLAIVNRLREVVLPSGGTTPPAGDAKPGPKYGQQHARLFWQDTWIQVMELYNETTGRGAGADVAGTVDRGFLTGLIPALIARGYDPIGPLAVHAHETGYGSSFACRSYNNLWGVSYYDPDQKKMRPYLYDSLNHCVEHWFAVVGRWSDAMAVKGDAVKFVKALDDHHYGPNQGSSWRRDVLAMVASMEAYYASQQQ